MVEQIRVSDSFPDKLFRSAESESLADGEWFMNKLKYLEQIMRRVK